MSIIHEALKKVEESGGKEQKGRLDKKPEFKHKFYSVFALFVCLGFLVTNISFRLISKRLLKNVAVVRDQTGISENDNVSTENPPSLPILKDTEDAQPRFVLNGVFFSENEGYALINNRIVRVGDQIEGATVREVTLDGVKIESKGSIIKLSK